MQNLVDVQVTRTSGRSFSRCEAIDLLNTLENVVNKASIGKAFVEFKKEDDNIRYILTIKQTEL